MSVVFSLLIWLITTNNNVASTILCRSCVYNRETSRPKTNKLHSRMPGWDIQKQDNYMEYRDVIVYAIMSVRPAVRPYGHSARDVLKLKTTGSQARSRLESSNREFLQANIALYSHFTSLLREANCELGGVVLASVVPVVSRQAGKTSAIFFIYTTPAKIWLRE